MSSDPSDERPGSSGGTLSSLTDADRAFLLAMAAWGTPPQTENGPAEFPSDFRAESAIGLRRPALRGFARLWCTTTHWLRSASRRKRGSGSR